MYVTRSDNSRSRICPPNFKPETFSNGIRRYYFKGTCVRCRKPFVPIVLSKNMGSQLFSLNICEDCIISTSTSNVKLRGCGEEIWNNNFDTPKIFYFDFDMKPNDLSYREEQVLQRSKTASYGVLMDTKDRRDDSRRLIVKQMASAYKVTEGINISWGFDNKQFDEYFGEVDVSSSAGIVRRLPHGWGVKFYNDGSVYVGQWVKGKRQSDVAAQWTKPDGSEYRGTYLNDMKHGNGILRYRNGSIYTGEFAKGLEHGRGTIDYENGSKFDGKFRFGKRDGPGVFKTQQGEPDRRTFRDLEAYEIEKPMVEMNNDDVNEDLGDPENVLIFFQPESLLKLSLQRVSNLMSTRRNLFPAARLMRVLTSALKPMIAFQYLSTSTSTSTAPTVSSTRTDLYSSFVSSASSQAFDAQVEIIKTSEIVLSSADIDALLYFHCANINISSLIFRANKLETLSVYYIVSELLKNSWPNITHIDLSFNKLDNISIENLMKGIKILKKCKILKLSNCKIDSISTGLISNLIENDEQIIDIDLSFNFIRSLGAEKFAFALTRNSTLQYVNLRMNDLGVLGGGYLAQAMKYNSTLKILCLVDNNVGMDVMTLLSGRLGKSSGVRDVMLAVRTEELVTPLRYREGRFDKWKPK